MKTQQDTFEPLPASDLFAVGNVFTFIADHSVRWTVFAVTEYDVRLDHPSGGHLTGPIVIGKCYLERALAEDRARRVDTANDEHRQRA